MNSTAPSRGGWRGQSGWLLGCAILGAIVLIWPTWDEWRDYRSKRPLDPITVAAGTRVDFGGARWQLGSVEIIDPHALHPDQPLPSDATLPNATILIAHFSMTPDARSSEAERHQLAACEGRLGDRAGRHWDPEPSLHLLLAVLDAPSCVIGFDKALKPETAAATTTWHFAHIYIIPNDVAATVTPEIMLSRQLPRFLRFARR